MTYRCSEMSFEEYQAELKRFDALVAEQAEEITLLESQLAEISELAGPGGDDTPKGRVEFMLCAMTGRNEEQAAELRRRDAFVAEQGAEIERLCDEVARHSAMLFKTVRRLRRICFAVDGSSDAWRVDPEEVLAAVRAWVNTPEMNWLNPPPEVAKILGGD